MKLKLFIIVIQLSMCVNYMLAQNNEPVILKEGDLEYIVIDGWVQRKGTDSITVKSYINTTYSVAISTTMKVFQSVFSQERAQEIARNNESGRLLSQLNFDSINKKLLYIKFRWTGKGQFPVKLSELYELEEKFMNIDFNLQHTNELTNNTTWKLVLPIKFDLLYNY